MLLGLWFRVLAEVEVELGWLFADRADALLLLIGDFGFRILAGAPIGLVLGKPAKAVIKARIEVNELLQFVLLLPGFCFLRNGLRLARLLDHLSRVGTDVVEGAAFPGGSLGHDLNFFAERVNLESIVFLVGCVPAERGPLLLLVIDALELASLYLKLELVAEAGDDTIGAFQLERVDELALRTRSVIYSWNLHLIAEYCLAIYHHLLLARQLARKQLNSAVFSLKGEPPDVLQFGGFDSFADFADFEVLRHELQLNFLRLHLINY